MDRRQDRITRRSMLPFVSRRSPTLSHIPQGALYVHAGCPAKGRSATLHALQDGSTTWQALPDAPGPPRGGTVLASLPGSNVQLARFGGFAGVELGGPLHLFDVATPPWSEAKLAAGSAEPPARSVHGFVGLKQSVTAEEGEIVAVLFYGEKEGAPPELGHNGAGDVCAIVFVLQSNPSTVP
jgi:hypothetical protein